MTTVGAKIAEAMEVVGKDGVITVEESQTFGIDIDTVEGMQFDKGYVSPYMITDTDRMEAVMSEPLILIANSKISNIQDLLPDPREGHAGWQAAAHHRRGPRGRGSCDHRREQAAWHLHRRRRQGAGLR